MRPKVIPPVIPVVASLAIALWLGCVQPASAVTTTFGVTETEQTYTVPAGVTSIHVIAVGAGGGRGSDLNPFLGGPGGRGDRVEADLAVAPGQVLFIEVGGRGADGSTGGGGGFNGGGNSNMGNFGSGGGGGGGATDIRSCSRVAAACPDSPDTLTSRLLVAGGGGGGGDEGGGLIGSGGEGGDAGRDGHDGQAAGCSTGSTPGRAGTAATQIAGGAGGPGGVSGAPAGNAGAFGQGGAAGNTGENSQVGGAGGGGYFGGGAGGSANGCNAGGGGGGSSFAAPAVATNVSIETDTIGTPQLTISDPTEPAFTLGQLRRNKRRGTAILGVNLPRPGTLALTGKGLKARASVKGAGDQTLKIQAKGAKRRTLLRRGRVAVNPAVTYTPMDADPRTLTRRVTLIRRR